MYSRSITLTFIGALLVGAWAAGCGDGGTGPTGGGGIYGGNTGGTTGTPTGGNGNQGTASSGGSSGGSTSSGSSGGSSSSGSSGGSTSSSSSSGGPPVEAGPPPVTLQTALTQFAACMSYSDFTAQTSNGYSAADVAKSQTTRYGDCNACHNQGDGGFWASYGTVQGTNMTMTMFDETANAQQLYILKWVTGTVDNNGNFKDLVPSNSIMNQQAAASQCMQGTPCHPQFQLNPDVQTAINTFVTTTITKWHAGTCASAPIGDAGGGG